MKMEQTGCSETSAYKIQAPGNYPKENLQYSEHGGKFEIKNVYWARLHVMQNRNNAQLMERKQTVPKSFELLIN
jgi:hypothetical protein